MLFISRAVRRSGSLLRPIGGPLLVASGISKHFGGIAALTDVHFDLRAGEIHALMGENGAGKSTLMKILSGVYSGYEGRIDVDGTACQLRQRQAGGGGRHRNHPSGAQSRSRAHGRRQHLSRAASRASPGLIVDRKARGAAARNCSRGLGIALDPDARVGGLRVGEQQLVEIAKALSFSARILIMDEPTSALSPAECERLFKIVRQLAREGVAIVYISHRIDEVMHLADRVTVFRDGRHVLTRTIAELDRGPHHLRDGRAQPSCRTGTSDARREGHVSFCAGI